MAHKIDFKTYFKTYSDSYGVYVTSKEFKIISDKLIKLGFKNNFKKSNPTCIWIDPENKIFECYDFKKGQLTCQILITPKELNSYLNKIIDN